MIIMNLLFRSNHVIMTSYLRTTYLKLFQLFAIDDQIRCIIKNNSFINYLDNVPLGMVAFVDENEKRVHQMFTN